MQQNITHNAALVMAHLHHGRGSAIIGRDLRQITGLGDRDLRLTLEHIRRGGTVVIGDSAGYYLPETLGELLSYIQQEEHRNGNTSRKRNWGSSSKWARQPLTTGSCG